MVLILFTLIGSVSANDVNTTDNEVTASQSIDLIDKSTNSDDSTILCSSTDENLTVQDNLDNDLIDKSTNSDDSTILCSSTDENLTVQDNLDNGFKKNELTDFRGDNIDDTNNINSVSSKSEVLSVSDDNILSQEIINYNDILGDTEGSTTISATITSSNTVSVTFTNVFASVSTERRFYVEYNNELKIISDVTASPIQGTTAFELYVVSGSGTVTFSSNVFSAGNSYTLKFYAVNAADGSYLSYSIRGKTYHSGMNLILSPPKATPTVTVSTSSITYAALKQKVSGTVKSGSTNVNGGTVTIKYNGNSIGSGAVTNGNYDVSIDSTFANPSDSGYSITAEYSGSTSYNTASKSSTLKVNKITPTISVVSQSVYYGQTDMPTLSGTVYSTSGNYYSGTVDLYINNQIVKSGITVSDDGKWSYTLTSLPNLNPGSYDVKVVYSGSTYASGKSETKSNIYTVLQSEPTITTGTYNVYYGQLDTITVSGSVVASNVANVYGGKINITIGTETYDDITVNDGGSWSLTVLSTQFNPNTYDIKMEYSGNNYCKNKTAISSGAYVVNQNNPEIRVNSQTISYGQSEDIIISGTIKDSRSANVYNGTANITIGDTTWNKIVVNNDGSWSLPSFNSTKYIPNTYNISVVYSGNNYTKFKTNDNAGTLTVSKGTLFPLVTNTGNIDLGNTEHVYVTVLNYAGNVLENISVILKGNGIENNITNTTDSDGKTIFSISGLTRGTYADWKLTIKGNDYYNDLPMQYPVSTFHVQSPLTVTITSIAPNNSIFPEELIVTGYTDADQIPTGNVSLIIGGKTYTGFFNSTGNFTASLIGVKPGTYSNITAKYNPTVDEFYYRGVEGTVSIQ